MMLGFVSGHRFSDAVPAAKPRRLQALQDAVALFRSEPVVLQKVRNGNETSFGPT